jgi:hypothetical protein
MALKIKQGKIGKSGNRNNDDQPMELCQRTGVRLAYAQLSANWVHEAARRGSVDLPDDVAVIMGSWRKFGKLPILEWGKITTM